MQLLSSTPAKQDSSNNVDDDDHNSITDNTNNHIMLIQYRSDGMCPKYKYSSLTILSISLIHKFIISTKKLCLNLS